MHLLKAKLGLTKNRSFRNRVFTRILCLLAALGFSFQSSAQQHFSSSQYMDNIGILNPSMYLSDPSYSLNTMIRKQWVGIEGAPSTLLLNGHIPLNRMQAATGLNLSYDTFGPEKLLNLSTFFAKSVRLSDDGEYLAASLGVGINRYEALYSTLDSQDPIFRDDIIETTGTIGLSAMFYMPEKFFAGVSIPRLSMRELGVGSKQRDYSFNTPFYLMMGYLGKLNEVFKIKPVIMGTHIKGLPTTVDFSTMLYIQDALGLGLSYGTTRELGTHISVYANERLRIGYAYQFGTESYGLSNKGNNTHEVGLSYRFGEGVVKKLL